jgi:transcriptional regulator with XRE-family HTH domain
MPNSPKLPNVQREFGLAVRRIRDSLGLTQENVAEAADLHPTYVSSVERGERNLSLVNIHRIAHALELSASDLLREAERAAKPSPGRASAKQR